MFYIAFIKKFVGGTHFVLFCCHLLPLLIPRVADQCVDNNCMQELNAGLMSIFLTRMVTGNITEIGIPWTKRKLQQRQERRLAAAGLVQCKKTEAETQFACPVYETKVQWNSVLHPIMTAI